MSYSGLFLSIIFSSSPTLNTQPFKNSKRSSEEKVLKFASWSLKEVSKVEAKSREAREV